MATKLDQKAISKVASKKILERNTETIKAYDYYRETADIIDRVNIALGKKQPLNATIGSTLNFEINRYGVSSTTAQKI